MVARGIPLSYLARGPDNSLSHLALPVVLSALLCKMGYLGCFGPCWAVFAWDSVHQLGHSLSWALSLSSLLDDS